MNKEKLAKIAEEIYPTPKSDSETPQITDEQAAREAFILRRKHFKENESKIPSWTILICFLLNFLPVGSFIPLPMGDVFWRLICAIITAFAIRGAWMFGGFYELDYGRSFNKNIAKLAAIILFLLYISGIIWTLGGLKF